MLSESEFIIQCKSEVFKACQPFQLFHSWSGWGAGVTETCYYLFCFPDIEVEVLTPLGEVCNDAMIIQNRVVIYQENINGMCCLSI